ncbi:hypothetical protein DPSP01_010805 [Paraphaeosphaeria sporulosa]
MKFLTPFILGLAALTTAAPAALFKRWPSGVLTPGRSYIYHQSPTHPPPDYTPKLTGVVNFLTSTSEVHVFSLPTDWIGKKVQVGFWYNERGTQNNTVVDIYSSSRTPPNDLIGSNNRDQHLGRFYVQVPGDAIVRPGDGPSGWKAFQLPAGVGSVAFEVVGVGSVPETNFSYEVATSGVYLRKL